MAFGKCETLFRMFFLESLLNQFGSVFSFGTFTRLESFPLQKVELTANYSKWNLATFTILLNKLFIFGYANTDFYGFAQAVHRNYNLHEFSINSSGDGDGTTTTNTTTHTRINEWENLLSISFIYIRHVCWDKVAVENRSHLERDCVSVPAAIETDSLEIYLDYIWSPNLASWRHQNASQSIRTICTQFKQIK